jgi:hypothetical protein
VRRRKDAHLIDISLTVSPIRAAEDPSKIARDITQRKRAEVLLHQQTRLLETLNQLARTIANDLNLERIVQRATDCATMLTASSSGH